jgi:hypothetical protein
MLTVMKLQHSLESIVRRASSRARVMKHGGMAALALLASSASVAHADTAATINIDSAAQTSAASTPGPLPPLPAPTPTITEADAEPVQPAQGESPAPGTAEPTHPSAYDVATDTDPSALTTFREPLAPYGDWTEDSTYGVVWVPHRAVVGADFAPYVSHGRWAMGVDNSWTWVSDFGWGWAPFHYGRWVWIGGRGWSWIPGRVYAPAWVVWRTGLYDDYYVGWAPMPPTWYWRGGYAYSLWRVPLAPYVFCSASYMFSPHVRSYIAPPNRVAMIAPRTRPYVAASTGTTAASYRTAALTRGPSPAEAHIPSGSMPTSRVSADPRAAAFARPPSSSLRSIPGSQAGLNTVSPRPFAGGQRPFAGGQPGGNTYTRPSLPNSASAQPIRPFAGTPQTLPSMPGSRPSFAPAEIPRPTPRAFGGSSGGSLRPNFGGGSIRPMAPSAPSGGSFGARPGGGFRPMPGGGGGGFRPRVR